MTVTEEKTVGEVVADNFKAADVFKKHSIDFCCGGNKALSAACEENGTKLDDLLSDLEKYEEDGREGQNFNQWKLDFLIDYILNEHHTYVIENLPYILEYAQKVAEVHGENHPETIRINQLVQAVAQDLQVHMKKEEQILFPYVRTLLAAQAQNTPLSKISFGTVGNPIRMMEMEHENAGDIFKEIAEISGNYTLPQDSCSTYQVLYKKLKEFQEDLHQHIHLENNILFPKAKELEQSF
ncbi:MAG: iron-sulfur cluster repair di-iron protein [Cyclobacteriaceae bacterium]